MNFRWKEAVWLALDDCGNYPDTQAVYLNVLKYKELTEFQKELDNQKVMLRYKNIVRNILNGFRSERIIEGSKENPELKYGYYNWLGIFASKEKREEIRKNVEQSLPC
jgi:hypothetical protein